jgi:hypothetical protein
MRTPNTQGRSTGAGLGLPSGRSGSNGGALGAVAVKARGVEAEASKVKGTAGRGNSVH